MFGKKKTVALQELLKNCTACANNSLAWEMPPPVQETMSALGAAALIGHPALGIRVSSKHMRVNKSRDGTYYI